MTSQAAKIDPGLIGFDFDGVIADIGEAFIRLACSKYDYCDVKLEQLRSFQVDQCLDLPVDTIEQIFDDILKDSIATELRPINGAVESLKRLHSHSPVTIITARPEIGPVRDWLQRYFGNHAEGIKLITSGDHDDKERYIRQNNLLYFIDDRATTCIKLAEAGLKPLVFSQPWNRDQHDLPAVNSWKEIIDLVEVPES